MANRDNAYERAFEEFLRARAVPYVAVDEGRRSLWGVSWPEADAASLKSLDFIVASSSGWTWLVDVKGRRFPSGRQRQYWKNWSTQDDLVSLARWENLFGERFRGLFVFAYNIVGDVAPLPSERLYEFRGGLYAFVGISLEQYTAHSRVLSPKWKTVSISARQFRQLARPMDELL